ncbi:MAG: DUF983 domain-containing protein [Alphaproteobacteria bacterium]|nr:DUF983 domain-containing protein [Alphaproteobacteria bacterium]MBM3653453.1 DUF983 domain-containing protein [Alphaproteobacteria bacterium]
MSEDHVYPPISLYVDGMLGRCPRCGKGHMIKGLLAVSPTCEVCGLDFSFADAGDGPAIFVMTIVGFIAIAVLWYVEVTYQPAYWVHAAILAPLSAFLCLALLRPAKGLLIVLQYFHKAEESRHQS